MPKTLPDRSRPRVRAAGLAVLGALLLGACNERERIGFLGPGDGIGPRAVITHPGRDTTLGPNTGIVVAGFARDPDGVDTVYFRTFGPAPAVQPIVGEGRDSLAVGVAVPTAGLSSDTIIVLIFATDVRGNRGDTATRTIYIP
jgi:hypothetical protein